MTFKTPARMAVVKKEEKEQRLVAFLDCVLPTVPSGSELCLLAQAATSPSARAVAAFAPRLAALGITVRVILTRGPLQSALDGSTQRLLTDPRCHDAHELLVVGTQSAWIGDNMRRNPATTDSFELHVANAAETTATVAASFECLWARSQPVNKPSQSKDAANLALAGELAGIPTEQGSVITVMTRH